MAEADVPADTNTFNALILSCLKVRAWLPFCQCLRLQLPLCLSLYHQLAAILPLLLQLERTHRQAAAQPKDQAKFTKYYDCQGLHRLIRAEF